MSLNWFLSATYRHASEMRKHVQKLLNAQRDILAPPAVESLQAALDALAMALQNGSDVVELKKLMGELETSANKWLKPFPNAAIRENVEVVLVALAVAMGIRTFFVQPFKIPTGSMQPTLFGVTPERFSGNQRDLKIPGPVARFFDYWIHGDSYFNVIAPEAGRLDAVKPITKFLLFNLKQEYEFNNQWHTIWFPSDNLFQRAGYNVNDEKGGPFYNSPQFNAGDDIVRLKVNAGDHLFVDRVSYNFRHPKRGEIVVFETTGIEGMDRSSWGQFYIKRMVAMGNEKVSIGNDRHLVIDGKRLDATTPHFENVYSFNPKEPPKESKYSGHLNDYNWSYYGLNHGTSIAPHFPDETTVFAMPPDTYMVMGDNTVNSSDSRTWGTFSRTNVIGKYFFVYWPFSERFGWSAR